MGRVSEEMQPYTGSSGKVLRSRWPWNRTFKEVGFQAYRHLQEECSRMNKQVVQRLVEQKHAVYSARKCGLQKWEGHRAVGGGVHPLVPLLLPDLISKIHLSHNYLVFFVFLFFPLRDCFQTQSPYFLQISYGSLKMAILSSISNLHILSQCLGSSSIMGSASVMNVPENLGM